MAPSAERFARKGFHLLEQGVSLGQGLKLRVVGRPPGESIAERRQVAATRAAPGHTGGSLLQGAYAFALGACSVHEPVERNQAGVFHGAGARSQTQGFGRIGEHAKRLGGTPAGHAIEHRLVTGAVLDAGPLEQAAYLLHAIVHGIHIRDVFGRPEPFGDGGHARPDAGIHGLLADILGPHAGLAAEDQGGLLAA